MTLKRVLTPFLTGLLCALSLSCTGLVGEIIANRVLDRMNRVEHYQARLQILGPERSQVRFFYRRLWHIHQEVVEPLSCRGESFLFDGGRFLFYSPQRGTAFWIKGIRGPTKEEWALFIKDRMTHSRETTHFQKIGSGTILGRKADIYRSAPKGSLWILPIVTHTWVDEATGLPLKVVNYRPDETILRGFEHIHIDFDTPLPPDAFRIELGPRTKVIRWDLEGSGDRLPADLFPAKPRSIPKGLALKTRVSSPDAPAMGMALFESRPFFLILGEWPEREIALPFSGGTEVRVQGRDYCLLYYSGLHLVHFKWQNHRVLLFSNLTLNDLLGIQWEGDSTASNPFRIERSS